MTQHSTWSITDEAKPTDLPPGADGVHASLSADRPDVGTRRIGAQACQELEADVTLARHRAGVNLEDLGPRLEIRQRKLQG